MKTYTNLYPTIASFGNLYVAYRKAAKGKRGQAAVAAFEFDLERNLYRLEDELLAQTYRPGPYRSFTIRDPKLRLVSAAPFRDRVVHHALCNVLEPIFERTYDLLCWLIPTTIKFPREQRFVLKKLTWFGPGRVRRSP